MCDIKLISKEEQLSLTDFLAEMHNALTPVLTHVYEYISPLTISIKSNLTFPIHGFYTLS